MGWCIWKEREREEGLKDSLGGETEEERDYI